MLSSATTTRQQVRRLLMFVLLLRRADEHMNVKEVDQRATEFFSATM